MPAGIFSFVSEERLKDVLGNLQAFTGLSVLLADGEGRLLMSFGQPVSYCAVLKKHVFNENACFELYKNAGRYAQTLGEAYIFSCHANLNYIAFPLLREQELLGSVQIGPFLMDQPDITLVSDLAEQKDISPALALELYEELDSVVVLPPVKVNQLRKLVDHLLSPLLPGERAMLLQNQQKMTQQSRINETIQICKEESTSYSLIFFYQKEKELVNRVRTGSVQEVKALLNEFIGHVLFTEGGKIDAVRIRTIELTTLLSRVAIEGGADPDGIYRLNSRFLHQLYEEQELEDLCILIQEVVESFMTSMFRDKDKGNPYIRKALRYMNDHYSEHLELEEVADFAGLSSSYFSTLFHQVVGVSFREHLNLIRVEESKQLLLDGKRTLADIAVSVGFPDQSYYCKVFKRMLGITPGKYRG